MRTAYIEKRYSCILNPPLKRGVFFGSAKMTQNAAISFEIPPASPPPVPYARFWLALACLVIYGKFLNNPLIFDDMHSVQTDKFLNAYSWMFDFTLRWFSYATFSWTHKLFGINLSWHRIVNLALHVAVVLSLYALLQRIFKAVLTNDSEEWHSSARIAFWGALIFAVHPVAVYATGYLIERSIVMATLFSILTLTCFLRGLLGEGWKWFFFAGLCYFLAVFSKEHAVMLPFALMAMVLLLRDDRIVNFRKLIIPFIGYIAIALLITLKTKGMLGAAYEPNVAGVIAGLSRESGNVTGANAHQLSILLQCYGFFKYLLFWLLPYVGWMSIDLQQKFPAGLLQWPETLGLVAFCLYPLVVVHLLRQGGKKGLLGFALLFPWLMFFTEFVAIRIVESLVLYRSYLWMACLPLALPMVMGKSHAKTREDWIMAAIVCVLTVSAWNRLNTFSDNIALWGDVIDTLPDIKSQNLYRPYLNRGTYKFLQDRDGEAISDFNKALEYDPNNATVYASRGGSKAKLGMKLEAYHDFNRAIELDPKNALAYQNRGLVQVEMGNYEQGLADINKALELDPTSPIVQRTLAAVRALK